MPPSTSPAEGDESANFEDNPLLRNDNPHVSPLEQEVLDEYTKLLENMNKVRPAPPDILPSTYQSEKKNPINAHTSSPPL